MSLTSTTMRIHCFHSAHGQLDAREWLIPGSKAAEKVGDILNNVWIRKDVKMLSPSMQTSAVEGFHSVINQHAPKMFAFSYEGMLCRIYLAALHFNENSGRDQATDKDGNPSHVINYPRSKQETGGYSVRKRLTSSTYNFNISIINRVIELCRAENRDSIQS